MIEMEKDLFKELRESARKAIEEKGKPDYWDTLVEALRGSASNGHYCLEMYGRLFDGKEPYDKPTKMLEDMLYNQELYAVNLRKNNLILNITTKVIPLPADPFVDRGGFFKEVHVKINWGEA